MFRTNRTSLVPHLCSKQQQPLKSKPGVWFCRTRTSDLFCLFSTRTGHEIRHFIRTFLPYVHAEGLSTCARMRHMVLRQASFFVTGFSFRDSRGGGGEKNTTAHCACSNSCVSTTFARTALKSVLAPYSHDVSTPFMPRLSLIVVFVVIYRFCPPPPPSSH